MTDTAAARAQLFRAAVLDPIDAERWRYRPDAGLLVEDGVVAAVAPIDAFSRTPAEAEVLDGVVVPGFADVHIHWVQHHVRGRFNADLLRWLNEHIWPEESALGNPGTARDHAQRFFRDTLRAGITLGMAYSSAHPAALPAAFEAMTGDWLIGNVVMPTGAPSALCAASCASADEVARLLDRWGPQRFAITPRFALNCSAGLLAALGALAAERRAWVQTHLSESVHEVAAVAKAFPDALDYTDVYDRAGLITPRSVLGHCIHLVEREYRCLAARGAWIAHCPSSNEALGSGRMDLAAVRRHGIPFALGSDVGAGPSHSPLHVMQRFLTQHRAAGEPVTPQEALYRATLAGARCLGRGDVAGSLQPGKRADFVLLPRGHAATDPEGWLMEVVTGDAADLEQRPLGTWIGGRRQT